jgi:hypothetical protein
MDRETSSAARPDLPSVALGGVGAAASSDSNGEISGAGLLTDFS